MLRAALIVFLSQGAGTIFAFLRNLIIGRMVSVEDFGIVSTFALAFAIITAVTAAGFDRMLVQAKHGNQEEYQANLHFLQVLRGLAGAIFFLLFAWPYAWFLDNLEIYFAYLIMSVVPLMRGFIHFDIYRRQRDMQFGPFALVTAGAPVASFLVTLALIWFITDYRIIIFSIVVQQGTFVLLSHLIATRKWRMTWNTEVAKTAWHYNWPLLVNGLLIFAIHNGEILLVGGYFGMEVLGWFYVASLLTVTLSLQLESTVSAIKLPGLSRALDDPPAFSRLATEAVEMAMASGMIMLGFIHIVGPVLVVGLFGVKYELALDYLLPLAIVYGLKTLKSGPSVIALAMAKTPLQFYANLPRAAALLVAVLFLSFGASLPVIIVIAFLAEVLCVAIAYGLMFRTSGAAAPDRARTRRAFGLFLLVLAAMVLDAVFNPLTSAWSSILSPSKIVLAALTLVALYSLPGVKAFIRDRLSRS